MNESSDDREPFRIGFLLFAGVTALDVVGPAQVLSRMAHVELFFVAHDLRAVDTDCAVAIVPTVTFATCPRLDLICVPGGMGVSTVMQDEAVLEWLRAVAEQADYVTSVCTGSLVLGAAGLLRGYRAACHWASRDALALFGVEVSTDRVVIDRNRISGGGVTAGIDFAFAVIEALRGTAHAEAIRLVLEYEPQPIGPGGTPETARPEILAGVIAAIAEHGGAERAEEFRRIAERTS